MALLLPNEYDQSYFDGSLTQNPHPAGYTYYTQWFRFDCNVASSGGEYWLDKAMSYISKYNFVGKKVLELGCAKGFVVHELRNMGIDAYGIDVSNYAINAASENVKPYLTVGDARTDLTQYGNNEFDVVFSSRFFVCFAESELNNIITQCNRISRYQVHFIDEIPNSNYYTVHPLTWWASLNWDRQTRLVSCETGQEIII